MCWPPTGEWKQEAIHLNGAGKTQGGKHVESNQYMKVIQTHRGLQNGNFKMKVQTRRSKNRKWESWYPRFEKLLSFVDLDRWIKKWMLGGKKLLSQIISMIADTASENEHLGKKKLQTQSSSFSFFSFL